MPGSEGANTRGYVVTNPWNGEVLGHFEHTSAAAVDEALTKLEAGRAVFRSLAAHQRSAILSAFADGLDARAEELARLVTAEVGKTLRDSRVELERASATLRCSADEARQIRGEVLDSDTYGPTRGRWGIVHRRPLGIVLAITPFNFPINLALHKIGPAFAAGCPVLFKPGPQNTLSARLLTQIAHEAGFPEETLQCCVPDVPVLTDVIASDRVQVVSFTGGVPTARAIARAAGPKKLLLELGGNDPLIVFEDADLDAAVRTVVAQRFATAGQRCTAAKRVFVHTSVFEAFAARLVAATEALVVGDPADEATFVGPVVSLAAAEAIEARIQDAVAQGARVLAGGRREGTLIRPTVLTHVPDTAELVADETFGPVVPLFGFQDEDELVRRVNQTPFGLQAGVFTQRLDRVRRLFEALDVGALAVNDGPGFRAEHFPFGGVKHSGLGREGVRYCIEELTMHKTLVW
ncbi:MAG: aldehyde dehydrogenase family protein [Alphaproteobacteria bacterium]|nr:aldehyde dehydrogenase family protein [Alphaproteobacteria bacterium]